MEHPSSLPQHPDPLPADAEVRPKLSGRAFLLMFAGAGILVVLLFYGSIASLAIAGRLSPPPVSGTWCIDSRFAWLRNNREWKTADVIAVGSSATWRNLDFRAIPLDVQKRGAVNAAPCFLRLNQTRFLTDYLLEQGATPKVVMTVIAPRDFETCSNNPTAFFDPALATNYIEGRKSGWALYFWNFRLKDIALHALYADERRAQLSFDRFGSGPLTRATPDIGGPFSPDSTCYAELTLMARSLEAKGIRFVVATFPVMPSWAAQFDRHGVTRADFEAGVRDALAATDAILVDGMSEWPLEDSAFTDPVHLQWAETASFTRFVWDTAQRKGAAVPALVEDAALRGPVDGHTRHSRDDDGSAGRHANPGDGQHAGSRHH
jgi:hypothetical protein